MGKVVRKPGGSAGICAQELLKDASQYATEKPIYIPQAHAGQASSETSGAKCLVSVLTTYRAHSHTLRSGLYLHLPLQLVF